MINVCTFAKPLAVDSHGEDAGMRWVCSLYISLITAPHLHTS